MDYKYYKVNIDFSFLISCQPAFWNLLLLFLFVCWHFRGKASSTLCLNLPTDPTKLKLFDLVVSLCVDATEVEGFYL
jgi:hypothetical protein